ncbi:MAG: VWA domain-containing protein [Synechococcales cyanobacterium M58_A2018_015]|nr:VWA domain-containing protein [Synechococcales cyanobacterium M58_A2018_015]
MTNAPTSHPLPHSLPQIEFLPLQPAIASDQPTTLDVLVKIVPPVPETQLQRPPLNLGLVIDRSGSMAGSKIEYARQAASYAVQQLLPTDRVSIIAFDGQVETVVPSTPALEKSPILQAIHRIRERGSTALHAGWVEGGVQVGHHLRSDRLNRVLLLSDGLANVGETNPDVIANDVHGLAQRGISTTTLGVGNDYSEDLLEAMARSGDGNFYHIESPQQLPAIFQAELQGLMATLGQQVSLGIEPQSGVVVADVLNDLDKTSYGRLKLPNLVVGNPILVVVRLKLPAIHQATDLCHFRLAWNDPNQLGRQVLRATLQLPVVPAAQLADFPLHPEVQQQIALLMAARARAEAIHHLDQGDSLGARQRLMAVHDLMLSAAPATPATQMELQRLAELNQDIELGELGISRKKARFQSYNLRRSRPQ